MVGNPILRWDRPVMEEVLASQVSSCFSSLQLTAAFHEMVLLFQHVFRSLNETGCHTAGKALPHPCLKGKKTGLTQDRASRLQFGLTQDQAATHPLLPWTFIVQSKFHWYTLRWNSFAIVCLAEGGTLTIFMMMVLLDESNSGQLIFIKYSALLEHSAPWILSYGEKVEMPWPTASDCSE